MTALRSAEGIRAIMDKEHIREVEFDSAETLRLPVGAMVDILLLLDSAYGIQTGKLKYQLKISRASKEFFRDVEHARVALEKIHNLG